MIGGWQGKAVLWLEWAVLFVLLPVIAWLDLIHASKFLIFAVPFVYTLIVARLTRLSPPPERPQPPRFRQVWLLRLALCAPAITLLTWWLMPESFLGFPRSSFDWWLVVMALYPFLSALPQEFMYRRFYFARYERIFGSGPVLFWSSVLAFSGLHLMYDHWMSLLLTLIAGYFFTQTYQRTGRLLDAWWEHALYGNLVFTVGLGRYFYEAVTR
ncbi:MAG: membrane protein of unknown function [Puniceicoccaceae bacterium 5H]|nr:MAG: membrane protein of unknown function [Puniceicoccaceae bacterium 5H]